jgi:hypothetical protein
MNSPGIRKDIRHREKVIRKRERILGLQALYATHENSPNPDHEYLRELRAKIRSADQNLTGMKEIDEMEDF